MASYFNKVIKVVTFSQSTASEGSDSVIDFSCSPCLEQKIAKLADFYCKTCLKFYCAKCKKMHGKLFVNHVPYGRGETSKWPVSKEVEDLFLKCDLHNDIHLDMFCDDHSQLCCTKCAFLNHRQCAKVTQISKSVEGPPPDLQQLLRKIKTILKELKKLENNLDTNMRFLKASYKKQLQEISKTRQKLNEILDEMEKTTMKELDDEMTSLKASVKTDMDNCIQLKNELTQLSDALKEIVDKSKAELLFVASKKCLEKIKHSETYLKENSVQIKSSLTFQANGDIQQYLSKLSGLGRILVCTQAVPLHDDPDQIFTVQGGSLKSLLTASFSEEIFYISAICVLSNDQILVADRAEKKVNLLNHQYQVVGHCNVNGYPFDICQITPSEVAVAVDKDKTNEVQFISVNDGLLSNGTTFQLEHKCIGIAYNLQDMYLSSGTALYKYSMQGDMLEKLYEDTSALKTVNKCAVSPSGDKIFVTNYYHDKVLTLATDGTVLHTFTDPDLKRPRGIHVTAQGQVLVCGYASNTILQLDGEGNKKLATLATKRDGLDDPLSVYFNRSTASIIVGQFSNNILVFNVK